VVLPSHEAADFTGLEDLVTEELNVKAVEVAHGLDELVSYSIKPNFAVLGPRYGAQVKAIAAALGGADPRSLVEELETAGTVTIDVDGTPISLDRADLDVRVEGRQGFALAQDGPYGVALDVEPSEELIAEGTAREVVRAIQDLRKSSGLAIEDRIELWLASAEDVVSEALRAHLGFIASEVLATSSHLNEGPPDDATTTDVHVEHGGVQIALRRAG
jgi:isoleucyl-tRNA synthetase